MKLLPKDFVPEVVVAVAAHADDIDFFAGGTLAKWTAAGAAVYLIVLTDGSKGSPDVSQSGAELTATRQREQAKAGHALGLKEVIFGDFEDNDLAHTKAVRRFLVEHIRRIKPDTMVTWDPKLVYSEPHGYMNHSDHIETGLATHFAVWPDARNARTFPDLAKAGLEPHIVKRMLYMTLPDGTNEKVISVSDITDFVDEKREAMAAHGSQHESVPRFEAIEKAVGQAVGVVHGEAFILVEVLD
jgi:LmbE family N-acetylglucosaminyl deacetylase